MTTTKQRLKRLEIAVKEGKQDLIAVARVKQLKLIKARGKLNKLSRGKLTKTERTSLTMKKRKVNKAINVEQKFIDKISKKQFK